LGQCAKKIDFLPPNYVDFLSLIGYHNPTTGVRLYRNLPRILLLQVMSDSPLLDRQALNTAMVNSIYLAGRDLEFIKAMLGHMSPISSSLVTIMETNSYE
jgi:hypothetical protein